MTFQISNENRALIFEKIKREKFSSPASNLVDEDGKSRGLSANDYLCWVEAQEWISFADTLDVKVA